MKALIDTNIIIDWLAVREPFAQTSTEIVRLAENGIIEGVVSASSVTDIFYIQKKFNGYEKALNEIRSVLTIFEIADTTEAILLRALESGNHDFEDAVQSETARKAAAAYIITRNRSDFIASSVLSISPEDFLKLQLRDY
ncbi:twitching motility protein PilT [Spirochaetia bacterium]|nr:twitching motility protein PilT [Spirochaetia bacterium]